MASCVSLLIGLTFHRPKSVDRLLPYEKIAVLDASGEEDAAVEIDVSGFVSPDTSSEFLTPPDTPRE
jgi:hypothetical protein